jgi:Glycosyltransferase family 87
VDAQPRAITKKGVTRDRVVSVSADRFGDSWRSARGRILEDSHLMLEPRQLSDERAATARGGGVGRPVAPRRRVSDRPSRWDPRLTTALSLAALSLSLSLWELTFPGFFSWSDSGMYFAASFRLVSGVIPYRDFLFVQPPGILLVMSPLTALSRVVGTRDGFEIARVLSCVVTGVNVGLLAWLVRHRGRAAMVLAGLGLALSPVTFWVSTSLKLEPYCMLFVLLGAIVVLSGQRREDHDTRSLVLGGLLLGAAGLVKLWAVFPFLALVVTLVAPCRRRVWVFIASAAGSFALVSAPFFIMAPSRFLSQVFVDQLSRTGVSTSHLGVYLRVIVLSGLSAAPGYASSRTLFAVAGAAVLAVAGAFVLGVRRTEVDLFLLLASVLVVAALLIAPITYAYYGYFALPFLSGLLAVSIARLGRPAHLQMSRVAISHQVRRLAKWSLRATGVLVVVVLVEHFTTSYTNSERVLALPAPAVTTIDHFVPAGSCVVFDQAFYAVESNRLTTPQGSCPSPVDPTDLWMSWGNGVVNAPPGFVNQWKSFFDSARFVVLRDPHSSTVPWTPGLTRWFDARFRLVHSQSGLAIFSRRG